MRENNQMLSKSFIYMFIGLMVTGVVSWYSYSNDILVDYFLNLAPILIIVQLGVVILFSFLFKKLSPEIVTLLFIIYAILTGITFSTYFYIYELGSIATIFMGTSLLFLVLSLVGFNSESDMSSFGKIMFTGLIIGFVMTIVNLFLQNSMLDIILTWALLIIFCGLTIYDVNKIKNYSLRVENDDKMHVYFAMQLYLDFINIFIRLLALFGKRK